MSDNQLAVRPQASQQLAALIGMERSAMLDTIKAQCFRGNPSNISNEQLAAFVSIAADMGVNPLLPGMLYAYPIQGGGIVPMIGPDGIYKKLMEHPEVDSWETEVFPADVALPPTHAVTKIWRKGRERPLQYTALLSEWRVQSNPNWNTRTRHMLSLRSLKQCARQIIHGIPGDEDDRVIAGEINVTPVQQDSGTQQQTTPAAESAPQRRAAPQREKKGAAAVITNPPQEKAIDVQATEAKAEPPKEKVAPKAETTPPAETKAEPPKADSKTTRAFLQDGEKFTGVCEVIDIETLLVAMKDQTTGQAVTHGAVSVKVKGEFNGTVLHVDGAIIGADNDLTPLPVWNPGAKVRLQLEGKKQKNGTVSVKVAKAETVEESPEGRVTEVE